MRLGSLFAGIGGIEIAFKQAEFETAWAVEKDSACCKTYRFNHPDTDLIENDIRNINVADLEGVDIIVAGFPCQAFSIAGLQRGFSDPRGNLFFEIMRFVSHFNPRFLFFENVSNLLEHDNGKTFLVIYNLLAAAGYSVKYRVLRSSEYGNVPQIRDRIYIVAFRELSDCDCFEFPKPIELTVTTEFIINRSEKKHYSYYLDCSSEFGLKAKNIVNDKKSVYRVYHDSIKPIKNGMCPTLTASMGSQKNQVHLVLDNYGVRKLTIQECLDLQGFPNSFKFPNTISVEDAYKQIGNSVTVPVVKRIAEELINVCKKTIPH